LSLTAVTGVLHPGDEISSQDT